ncbi:MAG: NUDIX domain-containing protein [Clostridia bacterium]|nr:NUDIX domain-containing protein [Clostridia bacterium]
MELRKEKSCGCIIIKDNKVLLVYEKNRNFWGFPKGHVEKGENEIQTALREVKEEVGLDVEINEKKRYVLNYIIRDEIDKTTVLFLATPKNEQIIMQESEIENIKWCDFEEAINTLTFENWKELLKKVIEELD